jgi:hypothetical protein
LDVYTDSLNHWLDRAIRELRRAALTVPGNAARIKDADHNTLSTDLQQLEALTGRAAS